MPELHCTCGKVRLDIERAPIIVAECHCTSCRTAAAALETLPGLPRFREDNGGTPFVLYRKDRVRFREGAQLLVEHRLSPSSKTRRVVASCCNTPVFLEFQSGHWLSLYSCMWPSGTAPAVQLRTMTSDLPDPSVLPDDVPNRKTQSASFFAKLLGAWIAMGFRSPKIPVAGTLEL